LVWQVVRVALCTDDGNLIYIRIGVYFTLGRVMGIPSRFWPRLKTGVVEISGKFWVGFRLRG